MRPYDVIKILLTVDYLYVANDNLTSLICKTSVIEGVCWSLWPNARDTQRRRKRKKTFFLSILSYVARCTTSASWNACYAGYSTEARPSAKLVPFATVSWDVPRKRRCHEGMPHVSDRISELRFVSHHFSYLI